PAQTQSNDLKTGIHEYYVSSNSTAKIACQEHSSIGNFGRVGVSSERSVCRDAFQNLREIFNASRGCGFYGTGGDCIHANFRRPKVTREIANTRLERSFGNTHDVIVLHYPSGSQVSQ